MIVKFRDNNISRLEKIIKEKQGLEPALQQTIVSVPTLRSMICVPWVLDKHSLSSVGHTLHL